ncbi:PREDICTED: uncharacterized protein LOC104801530 [Tarenaya hassleriana]|uniref:uncharacterized protein LOC104801530 n=1 Tax=Tarenaya hassleriana TaxID=28532 RepID=UPI00053C5F9C|nr:PREDICTED: uncharacterized protein LOC104801530 [Tarenaya hassleriana]
MESSGSVFDHKQMVAKTERGESPRSSTRLQRRAPAALQLDCTAQNPFAVEGTAIPLLSPLYVPPSLSSSPREGEGFGFHSSPDKEGSQALPDSQGGWQHPAISEHSELVTMFQTKFVLVNDSR